MTPSDEHDIVHVIDSQAKMILSKRKPVINMLDHPSPEITSSDRILTALS
jgi:hypothetical protein